MKVENKLCKIDRYHFDGLNQSFYPRIVFMAVKMLRRSIKVNRTKSCYSVC